MKGQDGEYCAADQGLIQHHDLTKGGGFGKSSEDDGTALDYYHEIKVGKDIDDYDGYFKHGLQGEGEEDELNRFLDQHSPTPSEEEESALAKDKKDCHGTVFTGVLNISNTIMGSGMLALVGSFDLTR